MRHFLAIRQDNNGDVTLAGPALRALAAHGRVTLVCGPSGAGAAHLLPGVDDVVEVRANWIDGQPAAVDPAQISDDIARYAALRADEAFIFTSFHQSPLPTALLLRLARVPRIAAISVDYPGTLLDLRASVPDDIHEVERALALVRAAGYAPAAHDDGRLRYRELPPRRAGLPQDYVVVQPGATVPARSWAPEKSRALVARLRGCGWAVVVVGSAAEAELVRGVVGDSGALDLAGATTYAEFAAVVRDARALIVGNSAGIHVAGAVGTPVVTIFAPTIAPVRFAPWRVPHVLLGDHAIACAGCRARVCPIPGQPCIGTIGADAVVAALESLVARNVVPREVVA